jgi:hypothetical protein
MGANSTQAMAIVMMLIAFILLAAFLAEGGVICALGAVATLGVSVFLFLKCKPWEHQE